jgi:hypothetical protein
VSQKIVKYLLPFSTPSRNRRQPFTEESEIAAIFCLAELERSKGGKFVGKQPPEKLGFMAKVSYPFWMIPFNNITLFFDGLHTTSHTITYPIIPDIQEFLENLNRSSKTRQNYIQFLQDSTNYFQTPITEEKKVMDGLITDLELLDTLSKYMTEATKIRTQLPEIVFVSPSIDESLVFSLTQDLQNLKSKFEEEIKALNKGMKLLSEKTKGFIKNMQSQIEKVRSKFDKEIEKFKASKAKEIEKIRKEYDEKIAETSEITEEKLLSLQKEKIKLDKTKDQLTSEIDRCDLEIKSSTIEKDGVSESKWKEKKNQVRKELSEIEGKLKVVNKEIEAMKNEKKLKIFELRSECDAKVKETMKDLVEIESSRDAQIHVYTEEMEKLEELTSNIITQIDKLIKLRETSIAQFEKLGVKHQPKKNALVHMPFYLVCYQSETRKRYVCFPPSIVNKVGLGVKFKGAFGKAKIKQLLQPRSPKLASLLNKFPLIMEQNAVFNRDMNEACNKANLLQKNNILELIKQGLETLKEEGWVSERECQTFIEILA